MLFLDVSEDNNFLDFFSSDFFSHDDFFIGMKQYYVYFLFGVSILIDFLFLL